MLQRWRESLEQNFLWIEHFSLGSAFTRIAVPIAASCSGGGTIPCTPGDRRAGKQLFGGEPGGYNLNLSPKSALAAKAAGGILDGVRKTVASRLRAPTFPLHSVPARDTCGTGASSGLSGAEETRA